MVVNGNDRLTGEAGNQAMGWGASGASGAEVGLVAFAPEMKDKIISLFARLVCHKRTAVC